MSADEQKEMNEEEGGIIKQATPYIRGILALIFHLRYGGSVTGSSGMVSSQEHRERCYSTADEYITQLKADIGSRK